MADAGDVALGPAGALGEEAAGVGQRLLADPGVVDVGDPVAGEPHVQSELVVLQEGVPLPGAALGGGDPVQCAEAGELPVAAQPDGAGAAAQQLHGGVGDGELRVLHADQEPGVGVGGAAPVGQRAGVVDVPHPHADLDAAGVRVAEALGPADQGRGAGGEVPVGVDDADDHPGAVGAGGQVRAEGVVGGVEGRALADAGVRAVPADRVDQRVPGQQLGLGERLHQVVVGAGAQPPDPVVELAEAGEDEDRQVAHVPGAVQDLPAVEPGQDEVEHHQGGPLGEEQPQRLAPVGGEGDVVAAAGEQDPQGEGEVGVVLDAEQPGHGTPPPSVRPPPRRPRRPCRLRDPGRRPSVPGPGRAAAAGP
ncbi:hypothetical protein GCM10010363_09750 [Streptomyces omiyaensis]|nr:hypothetical protein GCM10010363_09750 [Streptomyces omiyaensis]